MTSYLTLPRAIFVLHHFLQRIKAIKQILLKHEKSLITANMAEQKIFRGKVNKLKNEILGLRTSFTHSKAEIENLKEGNCNGSSSLDATRRADAAIIDGLNLSNLISAIINMELLIRTELNTTKINILRKINDYHFEL